MTRNYYTYSLSNNVEELSPRQFWKSLFITIHFGNDEKGFSEKKTLKYPKQIKSATNKKQFVQEYLNLLEERRERRNFNARQRTARRRQAKERKISDDVSSGEEFLPKKDLTEWALKKYFPTVSKSRNIKSFRLISVKIKNGLVYINAEKEFTTGASRSKNSIALKVFQSFIFFNDEINVTPNDKKLAEEERNQIYNITSPLINPIFKRKGINKYIYKLFNIQYDNNNNIHLGVDNKYSLGWSLARSDVFTEQWELERHIEQSLTNFYEEDKKSAKQYLSRKFLSKITTIGVLLEKLVEVI